MSLSSSNRFIDAVDEALLPLGFTRRKRDLEWRRKETDDFEGWIHLNIGKSVLNPSVGLSLQQIQRLNPPGEISNVGRTLASIVQPRPSYTSNSDPAEVVQDILNFGLTWLSSTASFSRIIELLQKPQPSDWPVASYSHRIRLLPLMLAVTNQTDEAFKFLEEFKHRSENRDQLMPKFSEFAEWFETKFSV